MNLEPIIQREVSQKDKEYYRIDVFELWGWRRLLIIPWTARKSNQSILKEISPEYSLERLMLKLKHRYFGHLMWRTNSLEKTLMLGKIEGRRKRGWQRMRWLDGITDSMVHEFEQTLGDSDGRGSPVYCSPWGRKELDMTEPLSWTEHMFVHAHISPYLVRWKGLEGLDLGSWYHSRIKATRVP